MAQRAGGAAGEFKMSATQDLLALPAEGVELHSPQAGRYFVTEGLSAAEAHGRWTDSATVRL